MKPKTQKKDQNIVDEIKPEEKKVPEKKSSVTLEAILLR